MADGFLGIFFDSWGGLLRAMIVGTLAYVALIAGLRVSGKRTLSRMNAFDLVVSVALGSTLATIILSEDVALAEGLVAFGVLIGLQYVITWLSMRSSRIAHVVKAEPTLVFFRGAYLYDQMRAMRLLEAEVLAAVRGQGIASLSEVEAVVLESDGSITAMKRTDTAPDAIRNAGGYPGRRRPE